MYLCMYACMYAYLYIYIYIYVTSTRFENYVIAYEHAYDIKLTSQANSWYNHSNIRACLPRTLRVYRVPANICTAVLQTLHARYLRLATSQVPWRPWEPRSTAARNSLQRHQCHHGRNPALPT